MKISAIRDATPADSDQLAELVRQLYEERGRGVGRHLLAVAEDRARARGCVRIMLNNRKAAESFARGFFAQGGFRERTEFANFVKPFGNGAA